MKKPQGVAKERGTSCGTFHGVKEANFKLHDGNSYA
jgi:hypothetical protein